MAAGEELARIVVLVLEGGAGLGLSAQSVIALLRVAEQVEGQLADIIRLRQAA